MFFLGHPLEGKKEASIKCMDIHAMNKLYGSSPVFIFDPKDKSNRPVKGYQDNPIIYWDLYPQGLKDLFTQSFTEGLSKPNRRITERQWLDVIANLITGIAICPNCGAEVFYDSNKESLNIAHICWGCQKAVSIPHRLVVGKSTILLTKDSKIYSHWFYCTFVISHVIYFLILLFPF